MTLLRRKDSSPHRKPVDDLVATMLTAGAVGTVTGVAAWCMGFVAGQRRAERYEP